jgi:hypothetical protein
MGSIASSIRPGGFEAMRRLFRLAIPLGLLFISTGCDSAMTDVSPKPEVTGEGPKEPAAPGKEPGAGKVDLGEVGPGGPLETRVQEGPSGAPRPVASPDGKAH